MVNFHSSQKECPKICATFSKHKMKEMKRNACCFVISFLVNTKLHILKEASESNPLLV